MAFKDIIGQRLLNNSEGKQRIALLYRAMAMTADMRERLRYQKEIADIKRQLNTKNDTL